MPAVEDMNKFYVVGILVLLLVLVAFFLTQRPGAERPGQVQGFLDSAAVVAGEALNPGTLRAPLQDDAIWASWTAADGDGNLDRLQLALPLSWWDRDGMSFEVDRSGYLGYHSYWTLNLASPHPVSGGTMQARISLIKSTDAEATFARLRASGGEPEIDLTLERERPSRLGGVVGRLAQFSFLSRKEDGVEFNPGAIWTAPFQDSDQLLLFSLSGSQPLAVAAEWESQMPLAHAVARSVVWSQPTCGVAWLDEEMKSVVGHMGTDAVALTDLPRGRGMEMTILIPGSWEVETPRGRSSYQVFRDFGGEVTAIFQVAAVRREEAEGAFGTAALPRLIEEAEREMGSEDSSLDYRIVLVDVMPAVRVELSRTFDHEARSMRSGTTGWAFVTPEHEVSITGSYLAPVSEESDSIDAGFRSLFEILVDGIRLGGSGDSRD